MPAWDPIHAPLESTTFVVPTVIPFFTTNFLTLAKITHLYFLAFVVGREL